MTAGPGQPPKDAATLHDLLDSSVRRDGAKAVFVSRDATTSYAELDGCASSFAATLRELGVKRGDSVAIALDGDVDYLIAYYGALMAGGVAVPLCADTRREPLVQALRQADARVVVLDGPSVRLLDGQGDALPELRAVVARDGAGTPHPGPWAQVPYRQAVANPTRWRDRQVTADDLASIVYTSGTTGQPKGVMLSHRNLVANVRSIVEYLALSSEDVAGMVLPFYYAYGNSVLHTHIAAGATIAHLGPMTFLADVVEGLARHRCTGLSGVPATFSRLLSFRSLAKYDLSSLRYLTQAGAAMSPALIEGVRATFPAVRLFVMYGQTEAAARLAYVPPERLADKPGSAGKAIPGVTLKICDDAGDELPRGQVGEVVALGDNIMRGYRRDTEATARVLRPEGLRTGDVGFMDEDGYLFLSGRRSELIKSGGHRISPFEVEAAVARAAGVVDVAVSGVPDDVLGETIAAFIVAGGETPVTRRAVLDACFACLPRFKMPAHLFVVTSLPRAPSGKLLRRELQAWYASGHGTPL